MDGFALHWVIRCSDLRPTLEFVEKVFGMKVIRHEENAEPCGIGCNGNYNTPWSKTMVGYDLEDKFFCLEVTYNYGITSYQAGTGLAEFLIGVEDLSKAVAAANALGFKVDEEPGVSALVVGPDGYKYRAMPLPSGREERFLEVALRAQDAQASLKFYKDFLGMELASGSPGEKTPLAMQPGSATCGYTTETHPRKGTHVPAVRLCPVEAAPRIEQWEGRFAVCLPAEDVKRVYAKFRRERPDLIMHDNGAGGPKALEEKLGTLYIFIARDPDGYELCIVSRESLLPAVVEAGDAWAGQQIDWDWRQKFLEETENKAKSS